MTDKQWDQLFALIEKAIRIKGLTAKEKGDMIRHEADSRDAAGALEEFIAECES